MSKTDLRARPIYHHKRRSIEAHLTVVMAALTVSWMVERATTWSIARFVKTLRRYHTVNHPGWRPDHHRRRPPPRRRTASAHPPARCRRRTLIGTSQEIWSVPTGWTRLAPIRGCVRSCGRCAEQAAKGVSIKVQRRAVMRVAESNGWDLTWLADEGVSVGSHPNPGSGSRQRLRCWRLVSQRR